MNNLAANMLHLKSMILKESLCNSKTVQDSPSYTTVASHPLMTAYENMSYIYL